METDLAVSHGQFCGVIAIHHARFHVQHRKHVFNIGHGPFHFPVHETEKIQRHEHLHHEGIDQHEVTQGHHLVGDLHCRQHHGGGHRHGNNQGLPCIEREQ